MSTPYRVKLDSVEVSSVLVRNHLHFIITQTSQSHLVHSFGNG